MKRKKQEEECNIKVVVRCRPLLHHERSSNVRCYEKEVAIDSVENRVSKNAVVKKFSFDKVYDKSATQAEIFTLSVLPMIDEVLQGFNCTVFAYGQTGTGKTHTMEGEMETDVDGMYPISAGIIPRSIHSIFAKLDNQKVEYSVRVSFLELYNEELLDLLADSEKNLRIFEDVNTKTGICVHNLEQIIVRSSSEIYSVLRKGISKRHTAQTKSNPNSSRSHCLFTVTIHMKETDVSGEDIIRIGTLNLVDLAGSESIGRSGARDRRAKEAGMINTSLLTLGRVICALVEHLPYIPYRDSKLTRLLQESLGGRAKTVIIATISPNSNEETISTLEYAHRAKRVMNKPEINQRMTHRKYVKDMHQKISDLQRENECLRLEHGIYLPEEKYEKMNFDLGEKANRITEIKLELETRMKEYIQLQELFTRKHVELESVQNERNEIRKTLSETQQTLVTAEEDLRGTKIALDEQRFMKKVHKESEEKLFNEANKLLNKTRTYLTEIRELHEKIDRQKTLGASNKSVSDRFKDNMIVQLQNAGYITTQFQETQKIVLENAQNDLKDFMTQKLQEITSLRLAVSSHCDSVASGLKELRNDTSSVAEQHNEALDLAAQSANEYRQSIKNGIDQICSRQQSQTKSILDSLLDFQQGFEKMDVFLSSHINDQTTKTGSFVKHHRMFMDEIGASVEKMAQNQVSTLQNSGIQIKNVLEKQQTEAQAIAQNLISTVRSVTENWIASQKVSASESMATLQKSFTESAKQTNDAEIQIASTIKSHDKVLSSWENQQICDYQAFSKENDSFFEPSKSKVSSISTAMEQFSGSYSQTLTEFSQSTKRFTDGIQTNISKGLQTSSNADKILNLFIDSAKEKQSQFEVSQDGFVQTMENKSIFFSSKSSKNIESQTQTLQQFVDSHNQILIQSRNGVEDFVQRELKCDVTTGQTPQKHFIAIPSSIKKIRSGVLLDRYRKVSNPNAEPADLMSPSMSPLPTRLKSFTLQNQRSMSDGNLLVVDKSSKVRIFTPNKRQLSPETPFVNLLSAHSNVDRESFVGDKKHSKSSINQENVPPPKAMPLPENSDDMEDIETNSVKSDAALSESSDVSSTKSSKQSKAPKRLHRTKPKSMDAKSRTRHVKLRRPKSGVY